MPTERAWYGPFSPWTSDEEKNEAVNQIERDLALWRVDERKRKSDMAESENGAARAQRQVRERR